MFLGKRYLFYDLFKMNVMIIVTNNKNNNKNISSSYLLESCEVCNNTIDKYKTRLIVKGFRQ